MRLSLRTSGRFGHWHHLPPFFGYATIRGVDEIYTRKADFHVAPGRGRQRARDLAAIRRAAQDLVIWSFAQTHVATLRNSPRSSSGAQSPSLLEQFQARTGLTAGISVMGQAGENIRLASAFMSGSSGPSVPDLCEIEINSIGQFLRPPVDDVGLLPLNDFLRKSGWDSRIIASRFAPWSKIDPRTGRRIIYGIPEDVHPVTITYRRDLFDEAGVDLRQARTWSEFQELGLEFGAYWANHGRPGRRAIALSNNSSDELVEMLLQRHINLINSTNRLHFTDPKLLETLVFYAQLIAGPRAIGAEPSPGVEWTEDFDRGDVCAICSPDWKAEYLREFTPDLASKVAMMPLPRFDSGNAPTSTLGGTMVGICRSCPNPQQRMAASGIPVSRSPGPIVPPLPREMMCCPPFRNIV